ncbi:MAG TPA: SAM-dependent methyltransferase [Caulobacteraceae bacterium]|nr:SAM-dependent methyltransferase [Caulobacteraceae bacterium]
MSLLERLRAEIAQTGPITVAQYMHRCLHDPRDGYYATRPALGEAGDFITAPLVSQMFGELIGLWAAEVWMRLGSPAKVRLVEVGPGDGTLMSDMLRAARAAPGFLDAAEVWLVETSEPLKARQRNRLGELNWAADLAGVPSGAPTILIANELLDCLPTDQIVWTGEGWAERVIGLSDDGLGFGLKPLPLAGRGWGGGETFTPAELTPPPPAPSPQGGGGVFEVSPAQAAFAQTVAERIAADGGAALLIDYGRSEPGFGDTLQALKGHRKVDPLACPGEADLTVHADFPAVLAAAQKARARTAITTQGVFLRRLGILERAAALAAARPEHAETIGRQLDRLVAPDQMGELFKAAAIFCGDLVPPGFEEAP